MEYFILTEIENTVENLIPERWNEESKWNYELMQFHTTTMFNILHSHMINNL